MPEMSLRPDLSDETFRRLNTFKKREGVTKTHFVREAIELYLDVMEGKVQVVPNKKTAEKAS